jgi:uncharacterized RDD family membrane protein YckC
MSVVKGLLLRKIGSSVVDGALELTGGLLGSYFGAMVAALVTVMTPNVAPETMQHSMKSGFGIGFAFWALSISFLNRVLIQGISRASIGKKVFKLELTTSGEPLTWTRMTYRWVLSIGSLAVFGAGYGYALFNDEERSFHDIVAGTDVVPESQEIATQEEAMPPVTVISAVSEVVETPELAESQEDDQKKAA